MNSKYIKLLIVILILALALRLYHLNDKAYGTDENHSINNGKAIFEKGISGVYDFGNPPLFYIFTGLILYLFNSILILKLIMVLIGIATIVLAYILASKIFNEKIGLITSLLLAVNPMHVLLSQHIRVYILLMLVYLISIWALYNFMIKNDKKYLVLIIVSYTIAFYLHYFSAIFIIAEIITFLLIQKNKKLIKQYIIGLIIVGLLCSILLPYFLGQYNFMIKQGNLTTLSKVKLLEIPYPIYKFSSMMDISSTLSKWPYLIITAPLVIIGFLIGLFKLYKKDKRKTLFISLNLILPIILLAIIGLVSPVYSFRYLTYLLPLYLLPISNLINCKKKGLVLLVIILSLWLLILMNYYSIVTIKTWPIDFAI